MDGKHAHPVLQTDSEGHRARGEGVDWEGRVDQVVLCFFALTHSEVSHQNIKGKFVFYMFIIYLRSYHYRVSETCTVLCAFILIIFINISVIIHNVCSNWNKKNLIINVNTRYWEMLCKSQDKWWYTMISTKHYIY